MLLGNIEIVNNCVRISDVDGSYEDYSAGDALDMLAWLMQQQERLLQIVREETQHLQNDSRKDS